MADTTGSSAAYQHSPTGERAGESSTMRWKGKVGPANLNSDYAIPFTVIAATRDEAVAKAVEVGGYRTRDSRVWITGADAVSEPALNAVLLAQAWRDGYSTGKQDYAGSITGGLSISTPNPYEGTDRG